MFFTTAKLLSIILQFMFINTAKVSTIIYWSLVRINLDVSFFFSFFLLPLLQDVLPKINNHKSGDCRPFQISYLKKNFWIFCKGKFSRAKVQSSGAKFVAYEISILQLCSFSYCRSLVLGIKRLNFHFILISISVG